MMLRRRPSLLCAAVMLALASTSGHALAQSAPAQKTSPKAGEAGKPPAKATGGQTTGSLPGKPAPAPASASAAAAGEAPRPGALGGLGGNNKDPIKIDADRLDVFDREGRAVFKGNVVAVQGDSTMRCTMMTVFYEQGGRGSPAGTAGPAKPAGPPTQGDSTIRKIDCTGPVTVVAKTQVATGDNAVFDKASNKVVLTGNVALSDGPNVTTGERIVYDMDSGVANVETKPGGRVKAIFVPGSGGDKPGDKAKPSR